MARGTEIVTMPDKKRFLVLHRSGPRRADAPGPSPQQMEAMFAAYQTWMDTFREEICDPGAKLGSSGRVLTAGALDEGPFVEAKEVVGGYMILEADSYERAVEIMRAGPALAGGGSMEIREIAMMSRPEAPACVSPTEAP